MRGFMQRKMVGRLGAAGLGVVLLASLAGCPSQNVPDELPSRGVVVPTPDNSVFLRASFDDDPSPFIGRFLPGKLEAHQIDENQGVDTRCSRFISYKTVRASGSYDEYYNSASSVGGSVGMPGVASAGGSIGANSTVRVKYDLTSKMRAEISDQTAFDQCCAADPGQCPEFIIGEFFRGSGSVFQAVGSAASLKANGITPSGVAGDVDMKDEVAWQRQSKFDDMFFAFRKQRVRTGDAVGGSDPADCSWALNVPTSLDGKYFVGISAPAASESQARDLAMRNARVQAVKYLGEYIQSSMKTKSNALEGYLEDESVVSAVSEGLASKVKDQKWCAAERSASPKGNLYTTKVLAFFPNAVQEDAAKAAALTLAEQDKVDSKLKLELKGFAKDAKRGR